MSATSIDSHRDAGRFGIGVMCGNTSAGWEYAQECVDTYRAAIADAEPVSSHVNDCLGMLSTAVNCHPDRDKAMEAARPVATKWMETIMGIYTNLSKQSPTMPTSAGSSSSGSVCTTSTTSSRAAYITIGTPEFFVERAQLLHRMGADQWLLRLDGMGHAENMRAIELIGKEVIPEVHKLPRAVAEALRPRR